MAIDDVSIHKLDRIPSNAQSIQQVLLDPYKLWFFIINNASMLTNLLTDPHLLDDYPYNMT